MAVKNMTKDLTPEQRQIILRPDSSKRARKYVKKSLDEFIKGEDLGEATLTELYQRMTDYYLEWPFRLLQVTVEVSLSRGFPLAVIDDDTMEAFERGDIRLDEIDPKFTLDNAESETISGIVNDGYCNVDYSVCDDEDRTIIDWDD